MRESSISAQSIHANTSAKANLSKTGFHLCHSFRCLSHLSCKHSQFGHPRMTYSDGQSLTGGQDASSVPANSIRTKVDPVYLRQAVVQELAISRDLCEKILRTAVAQGSTNRFQVLQSWQTLIIARHFIRTNCLHEFLCPVIPSVTKPELLW